MSDTLKPCPFCGGRLVWAVRHPAPQLSCGGCGATGPSASDPDVIASTEDPLERAKAYWNKRPGEEALQAEAVMLREARNAWAIHSEAARRRGRAEIAELGKEREALRAEVERLRDTYVRPCTELGCRSDSVPGPCPDVLGRECDRCCPMHRCGGGS